ncbi:PaaI family thioesterase [Arcanobacterium pinnipediorum]|uniref:PaaI family thioesterase n=1 Tax=Arcanobacterium pinnipediorum TaxID=1503041 RepID=A0ABY5AEQ1_9ACTO|nr:PaaI family thioesterase [Arcanobacterium pinnipediorum]USR78663.1 PaaI family thioesterase [Arcanobacterium pinnipediorum]
MKYFATEIHDGELAARLGVELIEVSATEVVESIPTLGNIQPFGALHGGANAFLVEDSASRLALLNAPEGRIAVGTELNISQLAPNMTGSATARAYVIRTSRGSLVAGVEITDSDNQLTAIGRMTCVFIQTPGQ